MQKKTSLYTPEQLRLQLECQSAAYKKALVSGMSFSEVKPLYLQMQETLAELEAIENPQRYFVSGH
jgi:hypothetical protein